MSQSDYIFRCEAVTSNTASGSVVKYKPIEVIKGQIEEDMLASDGFLNYRNTNPTQQTEASKRLAEDAGFGSDYYIFYIKKKDGYHSMHNPVWGFNVEEFQMAYEFPDGTWKGTSGKVPVLSFNLLWLSGVTSR